MPFLLIFYRHPPCLEILLLHRCPLRQLRASLPETPVPRHRDQHGLTWRIYQQCSARVRSDAVSQHVPLAQESLISRSVFGNFMKPASILFLLLFSLSALANVGASQSSLGLKGKS